MQRAKDCERDSGQRAVKPVLQAAAADEVRLISIKRSRLASHLFVVLVPLPRRYQQTKLPTCCVQEDDPLDAFMADLNNMDKQPDAPAVPDQKRKPDVGLDEEADNVADFLEV